MRRRTIFFYLLIACMVAACHDELDQEPEDTLVEREVFSTEAGTDQALAGAYYNFLNAAKGTIPYVLGDLSTDNLVHTSYYNLFDTGEITPAETSLQTIWQNYYETINLVNNIIEKIPEWAGYAQSVQDRQIAEAKFIRAYCYLDLLKWFGDGALSGEGSGLGVPLQLSPFKGYETGQLIGRSTNQEVLERIYTDLMEAAEALPVEQSSNLLTRSKAVRGGALALLARAYLYGHRYELAAEAANGVIDLAPLYALQTNLLSVFPDNASQSVQALTAEHVFALPISHLEGGSTIVNTGIYYYHKTYYWIDPAFAVLFDADDRRLTQLIYYGDQTINPDRANQRTSFKFNNSNGRDNIPMIRFAEVILTRAEALARIDGISEEAVNLLNQVRGRAIPEALPFKASDFNGAEELVNAILLERRKELAFEGLHRFDRMRIGLPPRNGLAQDKWAFPIPQHEIDISYGVIVQNPGYTN